MQKMCVCVPLRVVVVYLCVVCATFAQVFWFPFIACAVQKHAFDIYGHEKLALDRTCGHTTNQRVTVVQSRRRNLCAISCCYRRRRSDCVTVNCCSEDDADRPVNWEEVCVLTLAKFKSKMNSDHSSLHDHCENMFANYVNSKCITIAVVEVTITAITCQTNVQMIESILCFNCRPSFTDFNLNFSVCSVIVTSIDCHIPPKLELKIEFAFSRVILSFDSVRD